MKLFVFDPLYPRLVSEQNLAALKTAGLEVVLTTDIKPLTECAALFESGDKIIGLNPDYVDWSLPKESFQDVPDLKGIITQSTSFGWIDTNYAADHNIPVLNIRNFSTDAVADWAILMMLNVARKIPLLIKNGFPLNYSSDYETYLGVNLKGKKAGIVGLGNIGEAIAQRCAGLGMEVCYWNRSDKQVPYTPLSLEDIFSTCDVIFPALADTDTTKGMITDDMLNAISQTAMLISVSKKTYNHALAVKRAEAGEIFGCGFEAGPTAFNNYTGNVWAAPDYAWCTDGSMRHSMDAFIAAACKAAQGHFETRVN